jgi:hypothetical protein
MKTLDAYALVDAKYRTIRDTAEICEKMYGVGIESAYEMGFEEDSYNLSRDSACFISNIAKKHNILNVKDDTELEAIICKMYDMTVSSLNNCNFFKTLKVHFEVIKDDENSAYEVRGDMPYFSTVHSLTDEETLWDFIYCVAGGRLTEIMNSQTEVDGTWVEIDENWVIDDLRFHHYKPADIRLALSESKIEGTAKDNLQEYIRLIKDGNESWGVETGCNVIREAVSDILLNIGFDPKDFNNRYTKVTQTMRANSNYYLPEKYREDYFTAVEQLVNHLCDPLKYVGASLSVEKEDGQAVMYGNGYEKRRLFGEYWKEGSKEAERNIWDFFEENLAYRLSLILLQSGEAEFSVDDTLEMYRTGVFGREAVIEAFQTESACGLLDAITINNE